MGSIQKHQQNNDYLTWREGKMTKRETLLD